ncbi:hypothetical protein HB662_15605 [Roseomonas frigidaquae]|uniref:Lipoprotein n=1 Tax=Falsiroseomonas frigidaquae TaxID=487318 RepID=A0ABX1F1J0_9PROT|nr:hypothetical protein [Falsiroseomonas frigidaquae]NKE46211.1 hypothetical protein [Falsiroseomonas frigidaquae]
MRMLPILSMLLLAACQSEGGDFARPGTWRSSGANESNLRAMLEDPQDARRGRAAIGDRGQAATVAVRRLESGRRFPLPASTLSRIVPVSSEPVAQPTGSPDAR